MTRSNEEVSTLKRMASLDIEEAREILSQEVDQHNLQIPAARRLVDLGANPEEIKETLLKHRNLGVQLIALKSLGKHQELTMEERAEWQAAWKKEISRMNNRK